jgi:hypothetical protein
MAAFPAHPDSVTAEWLTGRLRAAGKLAEGRVVGVSWKAIGTGQVGDSTRFTLEYDEPGAGPPTVAAKFPAEDATSRHTATSLMLYVHEVGFYRELRGQLDIRTAEPYAAEIAEDGGDFVLLFEDLAPARGGNQLDGCTLEDARSAMRQIAGLHAPSWNNPAMTGLGWLESRPEITAHVRQLYPQAQALFRERYEGLLEPEYMAICEGLVERMDAWYGREIGVKALVHGDYRLDNMLFDIHGGAEPLAVLDWQTLQAGCPLTDIGYFLGAGTGAQLRQAHEDELLDTYCEEMSRRGVALTRGAILDRYRLGALHGVFTAVFSAAFVERTPRGDENFLSMARGACSLALDHDSLGLLGKA